MRVTIGDLDYYYNHNRINCFNPDVMKIASYHKQSGDRINFVQQADDIYRPYDLYYIIKEKDTTKNPPYEFFTNSKVRGWGAGFRRKINGKMSDAMLGCRPDYLLYPEKNTAGERGEQIRFLNDTGEKLPLYQDGRNTFKNKKVLVTDKNLWTTTPETIEYVLKELSDIQNVTFFEPIWLPKIANNQNIGDLFLKLNLRKGAALQWVPIMMHNYTQCAKIGLSMKKQWQHVALAPLLIKFNLSEHGEDKDKALQDFLQVENICIDAKKHHIDIQFIPLQHRLDTPYFLLLETVANGTKYGWNYSGLEWITIEYGPGLRHGYNVDFWSHPSKWSEVFRDLLRQTYINKEFLTNNQLSDNDIPGSIWEQEFKYGI